MPYTPVGISTYWGLTHTDGWRTNEKEVKRQQWVNTHNVLVQNEPTTICFLNTHGIRYTVQLCQHDLIKPAFVDGRTSMFVGTYITLCYTT